MVDIQLQHEVEQFLYQEAEILDHRRFQEWLDLFTEDAQYWMPIRSTRARGDEANEFTREDENSYFDDDKPMLAQRVAKFDTGFSWAEDPPSRTRHMVTNVRIRDGAGSNQITAMCNFVVYRSRMATDEDLWIGEREDLLRKVDSQWRIARRRIFLDQTVLRSKNLSSFL